jgi:two-component system, NtrC family, response regulator GlrR
MVLPKGRSDFEDEIRDTALHPDPGGSAEARMPLHIRWSSGSLETMRAVAGSLKGLDVVLEHPTVSRMHVEIEALDDGIWVNDLGSTNGTFVGNVRIERARVPEGVAVRIGAETLWVSRARNAAHVERWPHSFFGPLIGGSAIMRELFACLAQVSATDSTVLIEGETGTGKELVAQAIHEASPRDAGPFVVVDCAALPEHLVEGELFGHTKGAFTGALAARMGAIEAANGGTLFFDEIGELPLAMQPKLLRVIESRTVRRLGESSYRPVNVRFVAATHRDIAGMINRGQFREDLYFRLAVVPVVLPPLRRRIEDMALLTKRFMPAGTSLPDDFLQGLALRPWHGNVRELRNVVERALAMGTSFGLPHIAGSVRAPGEASSVPSGEIDLGRSFKDLREEAVSRIERDYIGLLLKKFDRNINKVAEAGGLDRTYVYRLIRKHDL